MSVLFKLKVRQENALRDLWGEWGFTCLMKTLKVKGVCNQDEIKVTHAVHIVVLNL